MTTDTQREAFSKWAKSEGYRLNDEGLIYFDSRMNWSAIVLDVWKASSQQPSVHGLETAARWHDERARNTPDAFEMELHQKSAEAIRALNPQQPVGEESWPTVGGGRPIFGPNSSWCVRSYLAGVAQKPDVCEEELREFIESVPIKHVFSGARPVEVADRLNRREMSLLIKAILARFNISDRGK